MRYITITTWEIDDGVNYALALRSIEEKRIPALKGFGASRVMVIRTSERTRARSSLAWTGLFRKSSAPASKACTLS